MAEIAVSRVLARGGGWTVEDLVCQLGPRDRPFEEQHSRVTIGFVIGGTFQYRAATGHGDARADLMAPGSVLLGHPGQSFECGHEHGAGDRCISFQYVPDLFERSAGAAPSFGVRRIPPVRALSPVFAEVRAGVGRASEVDWQELSVRVAAVIAAVASCGSAAESKAPPNAIRRVTQVVRMMERASDSHLTLDALAREAHLSPYHFLRAFEQVTGVTPHQYLRRVRLLNAAGRVASGDGKIADIAFGCGFGDVSNFNRSFRGEFGVSPRQFRISGGSRRAFRSALAGADRGCAFR